MPKVGAWWVTTFAILILNELVFSYIKSLALDPRSPSGIPRTPILVEDTQSESNANSSNETPGSENKTPKRNAGKKTKKGLIKLPVSKLAFGKASKNVANDDPKECIMDETGEIKVKYA